MIVGQFSFSVMAVCSRAAGERFDWPVVAFARAIIPLVLTGLVCTLTSTIPWRPSAMLWIRSLAGSVSLICTFYSFTHLPVSDVLTLTNLFPVWVAILSWPVLGRLPSWDIWLSAVLGVVGVALVQQPHIETGQVATYAAITSSFASSIAMLGLHRVQGVSAHAIVFHFSAVSMVFCLGALWITQAPLASPRLLEVSSLALLAGVGLSATFGQFCLTRAFVDGEPAQVAVAGVVQVLIGSVLEACFWPRAFPWLTLAGMALILGPTTWVLWRQGEAHDRPTHRDPLAKSSASAGRSLPRG